MTTQRHLPKLLLLAAIAVAVPACSSADTAVAAEAPPAAAAASVPEQLTDTPDQAVAALKAGNERFLAEGMYNRDLKAQVEATAGGQTPFAVVLGCIDSRVSPELVFDQGIGDIFSARIAGNFANTDIIGSFEFATLLAGARAIVVLGHTECGAIKGACDGAQLGNLTHTLSNLAPAVYAVTEVEGGRSSANAAYVQAVADENVRLTVEALTERSAVLRELVEDGKLEIVGAMYDVATGEVDFR